MPQVTAKYFKEAEFTRLTPPCSLKDMDQTTMNMADAMREICGFPLIVTCAYRSPEWDLAKKRSGSGPHTHRTALDFRCTDSAKRFAIVAAAIQVGFRRIGIGKNYIHVDNDTTKPQGLMWHYYET